MKKLLVFISILFFLGYANLQSKTQVVNAYNFEGRIFASYQIHIIKNGQILRNSTKDEMMYNLGFFGNLKTITEQNTNDTLENNAIEAFIKDIVETIKRFKS
jgi:hypothetical protein